MSKGYDRIYMDRIEISECLPIYKDMIDREIFCSSGMPTPLYFTKHISL